MDLRVVADAEELSRLAAALVVERGRAAQADNRAFSLVLAGGSTPRRLYQALAQTAKSLLDWTRVEVFWGDERSVRPEHADSNFGMAKAAMLEALPIPAERVHRLRGEAADLDAEARRYQTEIARACGVRPDGPPPAFDLVLLGMGSDGHTASLFPHTAALAEKMRWVVANEVPRLNTRRLTMTVPMLNQARSIVFLIAGADKAATLAEVLRAPSDPQRLPSQLIRPVSGSLSYLVDRAAAGRLGLD